MNLVYVIGTLSNGGAEAIVRMLALESSKKHNFKIKVVVFNSYNGETNINILKNNNIEVIVLSENFTYNPFFIIKLRKILKDADLVHTHLFPAFYFIIFASIRLNIKKVYTEHCTLNRRSKTFFFRSFDKVIYKRYDIIISISSEVTNFLKTNYISIPSHKLIQILNAVDTDSFKDVEQYHREIIGICESDFIVTQVSGFRPQKDQITAIKAFSRLPERFKLIFCGDGTELSKCKTLAVDLGLEKRIFFLGNRADVAKILKMSNVSLLSTHYEGMPLSLLESFASKRLVVASNVPGVRELVKDRGLLFEKSNDIELSKILLQVEASSNKFQEFVDSAFDFVEKGSYETFLNNHFNLYQRLIS